MIITLPEDLIAKIAAGEVIERPASCVKELIENSIDAGAKNISCEVKGNGVPFISVSDDGIGMTKEEIELAILPHTTSKIKEEEDLLKINTFGFRGEALPSIKKVSELEILTKAKQGDGVYIRTQGDKIIEIRECARAQGTTVIVRNLFFNVPVRRKFLKSSTTEIRNITNVVERLAIAHPEIAFSLFHNGQAILELEPSDLKEKLVQLFGSAFKTLIYFSLEEERIKISGYTSRPDNLLSSGFKEFIFVNKRPVKYNLIRKAVRDGYGTIMKERFPSFIIFIDTDSDFVDANIHPRKEEVRFQDESFVYEAVVKAVRENLNIATFKYGKIEQEDRIGEFYEFWQFRETYILMATSTGLIIVDQHAAHERIIYEKLLNEKIDSQNLLFPLLISLTLIEYKIVEEYLNTLKETGFEIEKFGDRTVKVKAIPSTLKEFTEATFKEILFEIAELGKIKSDRFQEISKIIACKSAIKAGKKLQKEEMKSLIDQLFASSQPYFCPHGRPTMINLSDEELERRFGR